MFPPLTLHCIALRLNLQHAEGNSDAYLCFSFYIVFDAPSTYTYTIHIYIYFILISVVRHLYYTDTMCMLCAESMATVAFHGTLMICSLLPFVGCATQQKYVPHYTKLSHINQPGCFILILVRLLTQ